jgi:hypothetical protein
VPIRPSGASDEITDWIQVHNGGMSMLPIAELSAVLSTLESLSARVDAIGDSMKGTDRGDQQSAELHLIAGSIAQTQRRLNRMINR